MNVMLNLSRFVIRDVFICDDKTVEDLTAAMCYQWPEVNVRHRNSPGWHTNAVGVHSVHSGQNAIRYIVAPSRACDVW